MRLKTCSKHESHCDHTMYLMTDRCTDMEQCFRQIIGAFSVQVQWLDRRDPDLTNV
jgi:hypothetical protein